MPKTIDILVAGHICIDLIPTMDEIALDSLFTPGLLHEIGRLTVSTGGAVGNTGMALHRLGQNVRLMALIGDDPVGRLLAGYIEGQNPALTQHIRTLPGYATSYTVVISPRGVDRIFLHDPGVNNHFDADSLDYDVVAQSKILHFGYPPILPRMIVRDGAALVEIFRRAKAAGAITSLDMSLPDPRSASARVDWRAIFQNVLPHVDIFVPSIDEALFALRRDQYDASRAGDDAHLSFAFLSGLADELLAMGSAVVGFKLGERGAFLKTAGADRLAALRDLPIDLSAWANQALYHPIFAVEAQGTTGAGDAAYAGLLTAMLHGNTPDAALQRMCAAGAASVEGADANSAIPSWETLEARIAAGWALGDDRLPGVD